MNNLLDPIKSFLKCETPDEWIETAIQAENLTILLVDHCNCELKAAQTGVLLARKYALDQPSGQALLRWVKPYEDFVYKKKGGDIFPDKKMTLSAELQPNPNFAFSEQIIDKMVRLIKEELTHFEQVLSIMKKRNIPYIDLSAARYARGLIKQVRTYEPATIIDKLIIGAYIEGRSCERFAKLAPHLDDELNHFYTRLLKSEARHYSDYLELARQIAGEDLAERIDTIGQVEAELIQSTDTEFRFHSGVLRP